MHRLVLVAVVAALVAVPAAESVTFPRATATIVKTRGGKVVLRVEVARTPAQWERGLMFRRSLPRQAGMVFVFPEENSGAFWMKNTLIPLSIAFYDERGRILRILDMAPCRADPCPMYAPGVVYRGALEVNRGMFRRWGVRMGDRVTLRTG